MTAILGLKGEKLGGGFSGEGEIEREIVREEDESKMVRRREKW